MAAAAKPKYRYNCSLDWVNGNQPADEAAEFQQNRFRHHILTSIGYYGRYWR